MKHLLIALFLLASVPAYAQTAQDEIGRFVDFYDSELQRTGFLPDAGSTRETRIAFLQATVKRFCSPLLPWPLPPRPCRHRRRAGLRPCCGGLRWCVWGCRRRRWYQQRSLMLKHVFHY